MSNQTPLNPDAVDRVAKALMDDAGYTWGRATEKFRDGFRHHARVALAVAQPEVTSVEELDKLPEGSVFIDDDGSVCQIEIDGESHFNGDPYRRFSMVGDFKDYELDEVTLPARVLYRPEVKP